MVSISFNVHAFVAFSQQADGSVTSLIDWWGSAECWTLMINTEICWLKSCSLSISTNYLDWRATASLWAERTGHFLCLLSSLVMHIDSLLICTVQPNSVYKQCGYILLWLIGHLCSIVTGGPENDLIGPHKTLDCFLCGTVIGGIK